MPTLQRILSLTVVTITSYNILFYLLKTQLMRGLALFFYHKCFECLVPITIMYTSDGCQNSAALSIGFDVSHRRKLFAEFIQKGFAFVKIFFMIG